MGWRPGSETGGGGGRKRFFVKMTNGEGEHGRDDTYSSLEFCEVFGRDILDLFNLIKKLGI